MSQPAKSGSHTRHEKAQRAKQWRRQKAALRRPPLQARRAAGEPQPAPLARGYFIQQIWDKLGLEAALARVGIGKGGLPLSGGLHGRAAHGRSRGDIVVRSHPTFADRCRALHHVGRQCARRETGVPRAGEHQPRAVSSLDGPTAGRLTSRSAHRQPPRWRVVEFPGWLLDDYGLPPWEAFVLPPADAGAT